MKIYSNKQKQDIINSINNIENDDFFYFKKIANLFCEKKLVDIEKFSHIISFAGPERNGSETLFIIRELAKKIKKNIDIFYFSLDKNLSSNIEEVLKDLDSNENINVKVITTNFEIPQFTHKTLIIDGIFGEELNFPLKGGFASLVQLINKSPATVYSLSLPSGLFCEDNSNNFTNIVHADETICLMSAALTILLKDCQKFLGSISFIEFPHDSYTDNIESSYNVVEQQNIQSLLKERAPFSSKKDFGHAMIIAGQQGMAGCSVLAAKSCLRSGVGKVSIHSPQANLQIYPSIIPEAIIHIDKSENSFTTSFDTSEYSAIAIGPGIGREKATAIAFLEQIRRANCPIVIDADGINILSDHKGWIQQLPPKSILTPHSKEMERISTLNLNSFQLLNEAINLSIRQNIYIILKGHYTAICTPEGYVHFNTTGNPGMATAGSGDVLTGIIVSLLSQGYTQIEACIIGTYVHGLAGDIAAKKIGETSLIASDIIDNLSDCFKILNSKTNSNEIS